MKVNSLLRVKAIRISHVGKIAKINYFWQVGAKSIDPPVIARKSERAVSNNLEFGV